MCNLLQPQVSPGMILKEISEKSQTEMTIWLIGRNRGKKVKVCKGRHVGSWAWPNWTYQCSPRHPSQHHLCTQTGTPGGTGRISGRLQKDLQNQSIWVSEQKGYIKGYRLNVICNVTTIILLYYTKCLIIQDLVYQKN